MMKKIGLFIRKFINQPIQHNCRWRWVMVFFVLLLAGFEARASPQEVISLGLHTHIPPFMWKDGKSLENFSALGDSQRKRWIFMQSNLDQTAAWGGQWNVVNVRQWMDGEGNFARLQRIIEEHEKRGLKVVFRVIEDPVVFEHLSKTESTEFGFNREYFLWVQALAKAFGGKVQYFLIGNEAELDQGRHYRAWKPDAPVHVQPTYDVYAKVLKTAVKAVKSVDSQLQVANSGFSDWSIALAMAQDIYDTDGLAKAHEFYTECRSLGGMGVEGKLRFYSLLKDPETQKSIEFVRRAAREPMGSDLFQFHYYSNWRALQRMLDWVRKEMRVGNAERPIFAAEVGYMIRTSKSKSEDGSIRWEPDWKYYSESEHAENTIKDFAILAANGVRMVLYWHMRESIKSDLAVRLFWTTEDPMDFKANRASYAFRMLAATLNGSRPARPRLSPRSGLWEFRFIGASDVSLIWSDGENISPYLQGAVQVKDIVGNTVTVNGGTKQLTGPLYVYWPTGATPIQRSQSGVPKR